MILRRLDRMRQDEGIGMLLVIATMMILSILIVVAVTIVTNSLQSSTAHNRFEAAAGVAESGIDATLAQLQKNTSYSICGCTTPSFASTTAERTWAANQITTLAQSQPSMIQTTAQGQYLAIRPSNRQTVYSMGWVPSYANPKKTRLFKAEYIFGPYKPGEAILTQGDLNFSGSVLVKNDDTQSTAGVHSNGNVTSNNSSLEVTGALTSSGNYSVGGNATVGAGSGGQQPLEDVPVISPRYIFDTYSSTYGGPIVNGQGYTGSWYDLCPDGYVYARDTGTTPCSGTQLSSLGVTFRGWNFHAATSTDPVTWSMDESSSPYDGVYYVYRGNAVINGKTHNGDPPWNATVMAESTQSSPCAKTDGDVSWKLTDIQNVIPGVVIEADRNFYDSANNDAGDGLFGAGNQVYMQTSSATLTGYVIAGDQCPNPSNPSNVQGVTLIFDLTAESPVQDVIRTTLWLEYPAH